MARKSKIIHTGISESDMQTALAEYATAEARERKINAEMDMAIIKIREKHQDELARIIVLKDDNFSKIQQYAQEHKTLFSTKKSMDFPHGTIGFRTSNPTLKTLKSYTWSAVTKLMEKFMPEYVRVKQEPDKERLLAERDKEGMAEKFTEIGVQVVQDEKFFIDIKSEKEAE